MYENFCLGIQTSTQLTTKLLFQKSTLFSFKISTRSYRRTFEYLGGTIFTTARYFYWLKQAEIFHVKIKNLRLRRFKLTTTKNCRLKIVLFFLKIIMLMWLINMGMVQIYFLYTQLWCFS